MVSRLSGKRLPVRRFRRRKRYLASVEELGNADGDDERSAESTGSISVRALG